MVTIDKLDIAIQEANRFLEKAKIAKKRLMIDNYAKYGCKETGAVKRASMDLSRALVAIRD